LLDEISKTGGIADLRSLTGQITFLSLNHVKAQKENLLYNCYYPCLRKNIPLLFLFFDIFGKSWPILTALTTVDGYKSQLTHPLISACTTQSMNT